MIAVLNAVETILLVAVQEQTISDTEENLVDILGIFVLGGYEFLGASIEEFWTAYEFAMVANVLLIIMAAFGFFRYSFELTFSVMQSRSDRC